MSAAYYRVGSMYYDSTAHALYICTGAGDNTSSVWAQISNSGGTFADFYDNTLAYAAGSVVQILTTTTIGGVTILPGTYVLRQGLSVPANGTGNQVPQYPYPVSGTTYWICISMGISVVNTCASGGSAQVYINSSGTF
jgi:hypothetical protein